MQKQIYYMIYFHSYGCQEESSLCSTAGDAKSYSDRNATTSEGETDMCFHVVHAEF